MHLDAPKWKEEQSGRSRHDRPQAPPRGAGVDQQYGQQRVACGEEKQAPFDAQLRQENQASQRSPHGRAERIGGR